MKLRIGFQGGAVRKKTFDLVSLGSFGRLVSVVVVALLLSSSLLVTFFQSFL